MKKEKNEFEQYKSGFFFQRFNRLLGLIRKHRVLPVRPGWEQTPDGIVPPPIYSSEALGKRPFQVTKTGDTTVRVNTGYWQAFGSAWGLPVWTSGDFNTDTEIAANKSLELTFTIPRTRIADGLLPAMTTEIGWYNIGSTPDTTASTDSFEIDFLGETVSTSSNLDGDDYTVSIPIATVQLDAGNISTITQYIDYNILVPGNVNQFYKAEAT